MMMSTIKVPPADSKVGAVIEPPGTRKAQPEPSVPHRDSQRDLESRIRWRRAS
jgi:hypothetical protein